MPKFSFPDPDDRSPNNPLITLENRQVIGLYNQAHPDEEDMQNVTAKVREWIIQTGKAHGWDEVEFAGSEGVFKRTDFISKWRD
ncbi:hypothetical protein [Selenomonas dianae]|uniref:Uncharacterized protein n=1 Tax=Selenomonas dianae TaxID=135079 RepID=A0ABN0SWG5_9FIRM|nr:hypothetical protein [Selenomonas dianae]WLD82867.1 hypothetical protein QU667_02510 [Selenomonas dianae]